MPVFHTDRQDSLNERAKMMHTYFVERSFGRIKKSRFMTIQIKTAAKNIIKIRTLVRNNIYIKIERDNPLLL
ncbi:hypothetical protein C7W93_22525 [Glaciimonas sp. PCH181]|nr:hypothetical protein C7W93_22525 [Glaciimonas sp. PCH181]